MKRPAIFMDRDGTICDEVGYVNHVSRSRLLPRSAEAVRLVNEAGFYAVLVTNQSGVARGLFDEALVHAVHRQLAENLAAVGARLDAYYFCPHHPREGHPPYRVDCPCRKPLPGMLTRAAEEHGIDLAASWMIGDSIVDLEAGAAAGASTVHVLTGYGRGLVELQPQRFKVRASHTAPDLLDAVRYILERRRRAAGGS